MGSKLRTGAIARPAALVACLLLSALAWAGKYKVLHNFGFGNDGGLVASGLVLDTSGNLYGATHWGGTGTGCGSNGCGVAFELTPTANGQWRESILFDFSGWFNDGSPDGGLVIDNKGDLFGTSAGGANDLSNVFELSPHAGTWSFSVLYNLGGGNLVLDGADNIYGFLGPGKYRTGAVAELSPGSKGWHYTLLYSFGGNGGGNGWGPVAPMSWDAHGNLYGTTLYGGNSYSSGHQKSCPGSSGCGVAFQMTPDSGGGWKYHVMHRFADFQTDGQYPDGGLVVDASGNAYGVTAYGGVHGNGTVFEFSPSSGGHWKQTVLYDFPNCANGCLPGSTLVFDKAGNLYGAASGGLADCGGYTCGVIFKLTPRTGGKWKYSVLHKFNGTDGGFPYGVILDDKGNLYGTTQAFGKYNAGVAFEISP